MAEIQGMQQNWALRLEIILAHLLGFILYHPKVAFCCFWQLLRTHLIQCRGVALHHFLILELSVFCSVSPRALSWSSRLSLLFSVARSSTSSENHGSVFHSALG